MPEHDSVRLDKWLWAARFFKTRSLATQAVEGGKVQLNGQRVKPAKPVQPGDEVRIRLGPFEHVVFVRALGERRGPASQAALLFEETSASRQARELLATQLKYQPVVSYEGKGRPTKRDRRDIEKWKGR